MAKRVDDGLATLKGDDDLSIGAVVDLVKTYAKQETIGPLKGAGRWIGYGVAGAAALGIGLALLLLGLLRVLQTEWTRSASGSLSWISYLLVLVACAIAAVLAVLRIRSSSLDPTNRPSKKESD